MTPSRTAWMLVVDESAAVRGAIRDFIEATTAYKVCDAVEDGTFAIQKAAESRCDLMFAKKPRHPRRP